MADTIVPVMFFLVVIGAPVAAWVISRVLAHQERMEMIRHGVVPPPDRHAMRHVPPPGWCGQLGYDPSAHAQAQLRRGIQVACIGMALLIGLSFIGHGGHVFGPWLLGGLIPLFVGIAQIITGVLGGASFGPVHAGSSAQFGPVAPPPGAPGSAVPPVPPAYGGWRPGVTPEIEKPAGPPDRT